MASHSSMLALFGLQEKPGLATTKIKSYLSGPITPEPELSTTTTTTTTTTVSCAVSDPSKGSAIPTPQEYDPEQDGLKPLQPFITLSKDSTGSGLVDELSENLNSLASAPGVSSDGLIKRSSTRHNMGSENIILRSLDFKGTQANSRRKSNRILENPGKFPQRDKSPPKSKISRERKVPGKVAMQGSILADSVTRRKVYLLNNKSYFLPLLPSNNLLNTLMTDPRLEGRTVVPYTELAMQPSGIRATLKGYQLQGLSFLLHIYRNGMSGILGDEMGLGKTVQTLSLFQHLYEDDQQAGILHRLSTHRPFLVICPLSVLNSWMSESQKWAPELNVVRFHGPKDERTSIKHNVFGSGCQCATSTSTSEKDKSRCPPDIFVTTYETLTSEQIWLKRTFNWRCIVLDEGHKVKNHQSQISRCLMSLKAESRYILTGTPLQNNLLEMWSLLHWMFPDLFVDSTHMQFKNAFDLSKGSVDMPFMESARLLLELIMLRRMKESPGVNLGLPPKEEITLFLPLTPMQQFWYRELLTQSGDSLLQGIFNHAENQQTSGQAQLENGQDRASTTLQADGWRETDQILRQTVETMVNGKSTRQRLLNLLMQLRKCCGHPYLLAGAEPDPYRVGEHVIKASSKFIVLEKLLRDICVVKKEKMLIFSGFVSVLNFVEDMLEYLRQKGMPVRVLRLDGSTARARRNLNIRLFNDFSLPYNVMLISTKAGGLGITLTAATTVVFLDDEWNPQLTRQAEARAHRIGQTKKVTIYKMSTQGTVEEQMLGRIRKKLYLSAKITESLPSFYGAGPVSGATRQLEANDDMVQLSSNELMGLIRRGAQALGNDEIDATELLSWDLPTIVEKCREKEVDTTMATTEAVDDEKKWLQTMEKVETSLFQGARMTKNPTKGPRGRPKNSTEVNGLLQMQHGNGGGTGIFEMPPPLDRAARREGKNTTVLIDGYNVDKSTVGCTNWTAVATTSGDTAIPEQKRERRKFEWQKRCQTCHDDAKNPHDEHPSVECSFCPRSYHFECLPAKSQKAYLKSILFSCPQHKCHTCKKATEQSGGMLFRCRWCPGAYCEDCLGFDKIKLVGDFIGEMTAYGFFNVAQLFWIECEDCLGRIANDKTFGQTVKTWTDEAEKMREEAEEAFRIEEEKFAEEEAAAKAELDAKIRQEQQALLDSNSDVDMNDGSEIETKAKMPIIKIRVATARAFDVGSAGLLVPPGSTCASGTSSPLKRRRGRPSKVNVLMSNMGSAVGSSSGSVIEMSQESITYSDDDTPDDHTPVFRPDLLRPGPGSGQASGSVSPTKRVKQESS